MRIHFIQGPSIRKLAVLTAWLGWGISSPAADGVWNNPAGGSWNATANWSNGVMASGVGSTADFSQLTLSGVPTVTLDAPRTNGFLIFGDQGNTYGWTLTGGGNYTNTLAVTACMPRITLNGQATTISAILAGNQGLSITGPGTLMLTATNTYTGNTTINNALVLASSQYALGANNTLVSTITVNSGATLDINGSASMVNGFWYGLTLSGSGTAGQGALINNGANGAAGQRQTPNISLAGNTTIGGSGTIMMVGSSYSADSLALNGYVLTKDGANAFNFCNTTVSGAGPIIITNGTVGQYHTASAASGTAFVLADNPGVTLALNNLALSIGSLTGAGSSGGSVELGSGNLTVGGDNTSPAPFAGAINGTTGKLIKVGRGILTLAGANSYTGSTVISNGAILVTGSLATTTVTVYTNGTLGGTGTLAGPVTVQGGLLTVATNGGIGATVGTLTIYNTLTLNAAATSVLRITKTGGATASDEITGMTAVTLGGTLVITNITSDGTALASGDTFTLFGNAGPYAGGFNNIVLPPLPNGLSWNISQLAVNGSVSINNSAAAPVFNPAPGGYVGAQAVTISSLAPGATIYFTTDGSIPTTSSPVYSSPIFIPVNSGLTIRAIVTAPGFSPSAVATAAYQTESLAVWTSFSGGSWSTAVNWTNNIIPNGADVTADLGQLTLTGNMDVTLDNNWTVGNLIFGDGGTNYSWEIDPGASGTLTLAGTNSPVITVNSPSATITAPLAGTNGLVKAGSGTLIFSSLQTGAYYTGNTLIAAGILELLGNWNTNFNGGGGNYTISNKAMLQVDNYNSHYTVGSWTTVNIMGGGELAWNSTGGDSYSPYLYTVNMDSSDGLPATVDTSMGNSAPRFGHYANGIITSVGVATNNWNGNIVLVSGGTTSLTISNSCPLVISGTIYDLSGNTGLPLIKTGPGLLTLSGGGSYTGATTVSNGMLWLTSYLNSSPVTIATNAVLFGTGGIGGPVTVQAGGTLAVGLAVDSSAMPGTLSIQGNLTLNAGSTNFLRLTKTGGTTFSDGIYGPASLHYGGTLVVFNITSDGTPLALGDTFTLFNSSVYQGGFNNFILPALPSGLQWDVSQLTVNGSISVMNSAAAPIFNPLGGIFFGTQPTTVTISSVTPGATIYYTTDGSTPTSSSPSGVTPVILTIPVNTNVTIQAYAHSSSYPDSRVVQESYLTEAAAVWTNVVGGSWSTPQDWINNIIPDNSGITADFSELTLVTNTLVTLDNSHTIGNLVFGDLGNAYAWEIDPGAGGTLTLAGTNSPVVTVNNQSATISTPLAGTNGLVKAGPGKLIFSSLQTGVYYTGNTLVAAGTLELAGDWNTNFSGGIGNYFISNNAVLQVDNYSNHYTVGSWTTVNIMGGGELAWNSTGGDSYSPYLYAVNMDSSDGLPAVVNTTLGNSVPRFGYYQNGLITSVGTVPNIWNGGLILVTGGSYVMTISNTATLTVSDAIRDLAGYAGAPLNKKGSGALILDGANTYAGPTIIQNGSLLVEGSLASSMVTVQSGCTLGGAGSVSGITAVQSGGVILGGDANGSNTLSTATLNLGTSATDVTYSQFTIAAGGTVAAATLKVNGTNVINISDANLAVGTNTLFNYGGGNIGGTSGFNGFVLGTLPTGAAAHLVNTGSAVQLAVTSASVTVATNAPVLALENGANALTLSWPADHLGWRLQVQTNSLGTNWVTWPGSASLTTLSIPINSANHAVFFRLVYP